MTAPATSWSDIARVRTAAGLAPKALPGPVGELVARELAWWCEHGHRFDMRGAGLAIAADVEARHRALVLGVTYG